MTHVNERWRSVAHRHFGVSSGKRVQSQVSMVPTENEGLRAWLVKLSSPRSSWATHFMKEPFASWTIYKVTSVAPCPSLWVLCDKGDSDRTFSFVKSRFLPLMNDVVNAFIKEGIAPASTFKGSEVIFVAIRKSLRTIPARHGQSVNPEHINGGLTHPSNSNESPSRVLVYRVQDAGKVLVHELLHLASLDSALQPTSGWGSVEEAEDRIVKRYRVQVKAMPLGLNESYTEVLACYLHTLWWAAKESDSKRRSSESASTLADTDSQSQRSLSVERKYVSSFRIKIENEALEKMASHIQAVSRRVWRHFYTANKDSANFITNVDWKEGTHCFSYVACRAALWSHPFLARFLAAYPPGTLPLDPDAYTRLIIEAMDEWISKNKKFITKFVTPTTPGGNGGGSLKMSCFT